MMWFLLFLCIAHIEQVIIEADETRRLILQGGDSPCEGYVKIYNNNIWGYLGDKFWNRNTEKVVCRSIHCGEPVEDSTSDVGRSTDSTVWLNEVKCNGTENHLWDCVYPGWNISYYQKPTVKKMKCSNKIKLDLDGFKCGGAVQYSTDGKTPSGYFCADNWGKDEADHLCKSLQCGESAEIPKEEQMVCERFKNSKKMTIKCLEKQTINNLWQCAPRESPSCQKPASVICTGYERVQLRGNRTNVCSGQLETEQDNKWIVKNISTNLSTNTLCQKMYCGTSVTHSQDDTQLTCSNKVEVVLMDNRQKSAHCYGNIHIKVNNSNHPVCASSWTNQNAEMVCGELNCGSSKESYGKNPAASGIMDFVNCMGKESSLWHCRAKHDNKPFTCLSKTNAYVVCSGSIDVRLKDGPGKCAGRVEIMYEGQWKKIHETGWTEDNSHIVCKQLKCGKARKSPTEKFSLGSSVFLQKKVDCKKKASNISECNISNLNKPPDTDEPVGIICEEHKVVFLEGGSCFGKVGIEHGDNTYWLSGSKETWNQESANTVCRQVHCGTAQSFNYTPNADIRNTVSRKSYSCSSNTTSLFDCENSILPSDYNDTIATVTCSGEIKINLTKTCWGNVNVCMEGKCGGVCADAWTDTKSVMLCKQLGCGNNSLHAYSPPEPSEVIVKSAHMSKMSDDLTKCNFVKNDDNTCKKGLAHVVCSGSVKPQFEMTRDKCSGNVEMKYENQWLPVCNSALKDKNIQNTICEELGCGPAVKNIDYFGPKSEKNRFISLLQCPENEKSLSACSISYDTITCPLGGLQCSNWKKIRLDNACSGAVSLQSKEENLIAVSVEGFSKTEGDRLCKDLLCGSFQSKAEQNSSNSLWNVTFNCGGGEEPNNIWDCETSQAPTQKKQLSITCADEPSVNLTEKCHGLVKINGVAVCNSRWNINYSHMVCQEQDCSNAIVGEFSNEIPVKGKEYYHVSCEDHHHKLGQCKRFKATCDRKLVSVYCVGNVKFKTTEECGGQILVNYRNKWENLCLDSTDLNGKLCGLLNCPGAIEGPKTKDKKTANLETTLECTKEHLDIKHCVLQKTCNKKYPAEIYCQGYVKPKKPTEKPDQTPVVPIILGVVFLLVLVILIIVFVRICIVKKGKNVSLRIFSRKEIEFESGDVEDFTSKANEMEDFSRGRFRSEAQVITGPDAQSTSSYDDIDEADEAQMRLTSQAHTAGASGDDESALDQSADGVTYEVDDPQENYDDIEASPEITQTQAEVHDGPKTTPEDNAVIAGLVQDDEDYLVPYQDG